MTTSIEKDNERADYTKGSILGSILKMGLPSMFGFLAQHIYAMADMFWVSRLPGAEAGVAAITFFNTLMWMLFSFNSLVGPGSVAVISRRYGEKDYNGAERAIKETILLKLIFGTLLGLVGWFYLRNMLSLLGAEGDALTYGVSYGRILLYGLPIMYATYSIFTALRGVANPAWAMILMVGSNILNAGLDPIFIFGYLGVPAMGIEGAAVASVVSYSTTFGLGLVLFMTNKTSVRLHLFGKAAISIKSMWQIVRIGIPAWLAELSFSGSRLLLTPLVAGFGTAVVAAYGVGLQVFGFGIMIIVGMGLGLSSLIGHNLGAAKKERALSTANQSILLSIGFMVLFGLATFLFCERYMMLFFSSQETIRYGTEMLKIWALSFPAFGAFIMLEQIHGGVGKNTPYLVVSVIHGWGLQVIPALIATKLLGFDQTSIWWIYSISGITSSIGFYLYYRRGSWLSAKV